MQIGREQDPAKRRRQAWGDNLAKTRKLRDLTRKQLADAIGVSEAAVGMWERGETAPKIEHQLAIGDVLDAEASLIFPVRAA